MVEEDKIEVPSNFTRGGTPVHTLICSTVGCLEGVFMIIDNHNLHDVFKHKQVDVFTSILLDWSV